MCSGDSAGDDTAHAVVDGEVVAVGEVLVRVVAAQHDLIACGELSIAEGELRVRCRVRRRWRAVLGLAG